MSASLARELRVDRPLLFILTNSRSMPERDAAEVNRELGRAVAAAERETGRRLVVVSRSDSTLRGHYPAEIEALQAGMEIAFDGHLIIPAFFEGGRYTIADTHWLASGAPGEVIPTSDTPFARDAVFGYGTSYLPDWVEEKSHGRWRAAEVQSVSLEMVRRGPEAVEEQLMAVAGGVPVAVNVAGYGDLASFTLGLLAAEARGKRFLYRTAASFVRLRAGLPARPLLSARRCSGPGWTDGRGALVVVGSHVPATTEQLAELQGASRSPV